MEGGAWLLFGLGNPGEKYAGTRHNFGQMVATELAARHGASLKSHRGVALAAVLRLPVSGVVAGQRQGMPGVSRSDGVQVVVAVSTGFMNVSGAPLSRLASFYGVEPERILVMHDELDLPFERFKFKRGGGAGGHNGLRDIARVLGTPDFLRLRLGVGRPPGRQDPADYVLRSFSAVQRETLPLTVSLAVRAVETLVVHGFTVACDRFNGGVGV